MNFLLWKEERNKGVVVCVFMSQWQQRDKKDHSVFLCQCAALHLGMPKSIFPRLLRCSSPLHRPSNPIDCAPLGGEIPRHSSAFDVEWFGEESFFGWFIEIYIRYLTKSAAHSLEYNSKSFCGLTQWRRFHVALLREKVTASVASV